MAKLPTDRYRDPTRGPHGESTKENIDFWTARARRNSIDWSRNQRPASAGKPKANLDLPRVPSTGGKIKLHSTKGE